MKVTGYWKIPSNKIAGVQNDIDWLDLMFIESEDAKTMRLTESPIGYSLDAPMIPTRVASIASVSDAGSYMIFWTGNGNRVYWIDAQGNLFSEEQVLSFPKFDAWKEGKIVLGGLLGKSKRIVEQLESDGLIKIKKGVSKVDVIKRVFNGIKYGG